MEATRTSKITGPRVVKRDWSLEKGEFATISVANGTNLDGIPSLVERALKKSAGNAALPEELKEFTSLNFKFGKDRITIRLGVEAQATRSDKFIDATADEIVQLCKRQLPVALRNEQKGRIDRI